jgi:hypothetical protein
VFALLTILATPAQRRLAAGGVDRRERVLKVHLPVLTTDHARCVLRALVCPHWWRPQDWVGDLFTLRRSLIISSRCGLPACAQIQKPASIILARLVRGRGAAYVLVHVPSETLVFSDCGWCLSSSTCMSGSSGGPTTGSCPNWKFYKFDCSDCASRSSCSSCVEQASCGWCITDGNGTCLQGSSSGPLSDTCSDWVGALCYCR